MSSFSAIALCLPHSNSTSFWSDGSPYFDMSGFVGSDGVLQPGETSQPRSFAITVTGPGAYSFRTHVTGMVASGGGSGEDFGMSTLRRLWPKHNPISPMDVNDDGVVSPLDALLVINSLSNKGSRSLMPDEIGAPYLDTSADNQLSPLDALLVVNYLNRARASAEGESPASPLTTKLSTEFSRLANPSSLNAEAVDVFFEHADIARKRRKAT